MPKGGWRPGGGRPKGSLNKRTVQQREEIKQLLEAGIQPLEVIVKVMRGEQGITDRMFQAAVAAAPYVHPRLAALEQKVHAHVKQYVVSAEPLSQDEWLALYGNPDAAETLAAKERVAAPGVGVEGEHGVH